MMVMRGPGNITIPLADFAIEVAGASFSLFDFGSRVGFCCASLSGTLGPISSRADFAGSALRWRKLPKGLTAPLESLALFSSSRNCCRSLGAFVSERGRNTGGESSDCEWTLLYVQQAKTETKNNLVNGVVFILFNRRSRWRCRVRRFLSVRAASLSASAV